MGILQARILEWVAMLSSRGSSQPGDQPQGSIIAGGFFTLWSMKITQGNSIALLLSHPLLNSWQSAKFSLQSLCTSLLMIFSKTEWDQNGSSLRGLSWRPYSMFPHHELGHMTLLCVLWGSCHYCKLLLKNKLVYCLFLWLKCKPREVRNYAFVLFVCSIDPSIE